MLWYAIVFFVLFLIILYRLSVSTFGFWKERKIPYLTPIPLFGSFNPFLKKNMIDFFRESYMKFYGHDYFGLFMMKVPILMICSPEIAKNILIRDFEYFSDRLVSSHEGDPHGLYNIVTSKEPLGSSIRKLLSPVFTASKIKDFTSVMKECSQELINKINKDNDEGIKFDIISNFYNYTTEVISAASFGIRADCINNPDSQLKYVMKKMTDLTFMRRIEFLILFYMPQFAKTFDCYFFTKAATKYFSNFYTQAESDRINRKAADRRRILLDVLTECKGDTLVNGQILTNDIIVAQGLIFFFAGIESSTLTTGLTLLEIAHRPDIQERLFNEIKSNKDKNTGDIDWKSITELKYLDMVCKESLRKYPVIGTIDRVTTKDYKIDDYTTLKKGQPVMVNVIGMHNDPKYFPEPTKFNPERFSEENLHKIPQNVYMPFGSGPRGCIGKKFGLKSMKTILANIIINFNITPDPQVPKPDDLKLIPNGIFPSPESPIYVHLKKRYQTN